MTAARPAAARGGGVLAFAPLAVGLLAGALIGAALAVALGVPGRAALLPAAVLVALAAGGLAALAAGGVRRVLVGAIVFDLSLQVDTHLFYRDRLGEMGALGGLNLSLTTMILAVLYGWWLLELLAAPRAARRPSLAGAGAGVAYVGAVALSAALAPDPLLAGFEVWLLLQMLALFVYLVHHLRTRGDLHFLLWALFGSLALQALLTLATSVLQTTVDVAGVSNAIDESYRRGRLWRAGGTLGSPNSAAAFFAMLIPPAVAVVLTQRRSALTALAAVASTLGVAALAVTQSRGGWVALALALTIVVAALLRERALSPRAIRRLALAAVLLAPVALPLVFSRLAADDAGSFASRSPLNDIAWRMIGDHPVVGVGANHFAAALPAYVTPEFVGVWLYTVHNKYLLVWTEAGAVALLAFAALLLAGLRRGWRGFVRQRGLAAAVALGLAAALAGQLLHMGVDVFNARPNVQLMWLVIALLTALGGPRAAAFGQQPHAGARR